MKTGRMHRNLKSRELRIQVRGGLLEHNWIYCLDLLLRQSTAGITVWFYCYGSTTRTTGESTAGSTGESTGA